MLSSGFLSTAGENLLSTAAAFFRWFSDPSFLQGIPFLGTAVEGRRHVSGKCEGITVRASLINHENRNGVATDP